MDNPEKFASHGTQDEDKQNKKTTQYVSDPTICKPTQTTQTRHDLPINNWRQIRTEHRYHAQIATDSTTQNPERKDTQQGNTKKLKRLSTHTPPKTGGELRCSRRVNSSCFLYDIHRFTHIYSQVR